MEGFEIRTTSDKGRGLFATRKYEEGEVIFEEEPLVSCQFAWNTAYGYLACDHCMRPLETPEQNVRRLSNKQDIVLPHPDCVNSNLELVVNCDQCGVLYCTEDCRVRAFEKYHRTLCFNPKDGHLPINILLDTWKQMHYPPETASILLVVRILAYVQQSADPTSAAATIKNFCHRTANEDEDIVHKLLGNEFSGQLNTLREMTANVVSSEHVQEFLTPEGFSSLMALIGTNGQGIGTSPFSVWVNNVLERTMSDDERKQLDHFIDSCYEFMGEEAGTFLNTEGAGLFRLQSTCNHSCSPNAESGFPYSNHVIQIKAIKPILPGEEICISYLDECFLQRSRHSRQKELAQNYIFMCWCERCLSQASEPECTSEEEMSDEDIGDDDD